MIKNVACALGVFLFAVFFLTASGHTYSPDEESLLYVTQSFVTRGEFDMPNPANYPVVGGHRGIGGKIFSGTGLAQSLIALPFYVAADRIADAFDSHFHAFILRLLTVSLFNSLVSALTGVLLYAWMRRLRASARVALGVTLVWAFATMAWIYARTFYSEPLLTLWFVLAGYALCRYHATRATRWMFVAGLAAGLGVLTKVQGVLVVPALALYFCALEFNRDLRAFLRANFFPSALFILTLAVGVGITGYFDLIRFGDALQTGHGEVSQGYPILVGLYGLLASPGKSVFLYAPPLVLLFFALPRFFKQHAPEFLFCLVLGATFVVFHARIDFWSGDGAWGPRYLVPTLPFFLVPLISRAGEWWQRRGSRALMLVVIALGMFVNVLGLTVNWDTYIQLEPNANARYFDPAASPLFAQWALLRARVAEWWYDVVVAQNAVVPLRGFLATGNDEIFPRYLAPRATLVVKSNLDQSLQMSLVANDYRPASKEKRWLVFYAKGLQLPSSSIPTGDSGMLSYRVEIPANGARWTTLEIVTLGSDTRGNSPMGDELGVQLQSLDVRVGAETLTMPPYLAIPPLPTADPKAQWAWFYVPGNAQFDFFAWYLYFSGLPDAQGVVLDAWFSMIGIICLVLSAPTFLRGAFARRIS